MPHFGPTTRTELIRCLCQLGFHGPYSGGKHQFMVKDHLRSTGTFSRDARAEAVRDGAPAMDLADGQELAAWLKRYALGVQTLMVEKVEVNAAWFTTL